MSSSDALQPLNSKLTTLTALLSHFHNSLSAPSDPLPRPTDTTSPNPLHILRDASTLLKAQTTKLSLLVITPPFTPSALVAVLTACESECLPALLAAWEMMRSEKGEVWPAMMCEEVKSGVGDVLAAFNEVVREVRNKVGREGKGKGKGEGSEEAKWKERVLATTGVVWKACERLGELCVLDVAGILGRKVESWRETLRDALDELKEWGEETGNEDNEAFSSDAEDGDGDADGVEAMFEAANKLPRGRRDLQERLEEALRRVRLVETLFRALGKRRVKTFSEFDGKGAIEVNEKRREMVRKMNGLMMMLGAIPDLVDELASAFYELDADEVDNLLEQISGKAKHAIAEAKMSWDGKEDEFTTWTTKWEDVIKPKVVFTGKAD